MAKNPEKVTYFGQTDYRSQRVKFGIKEKDRAKHMYVIGKTGMGKSTMLENLAAQDIMNGEGMCFIDPHGGSAEALLEYIPEHRINDVIYFAPFDQENPIAFNVMEDIGRDKRSLVAAGLMGAFKKVWVDAWSARMEYILGNALLALLEYPGSTLLGVNRIFGDKDYRKMVVDNVTDTSVRSFWLDEYAKYSEKFATEATAAIQNKIGQFSANPLIRNIVGQSKSTFDIRKVMDEQKILIINLSKGRLGEGNASLIGAMLITKIYLAAMSRADTNAADLKQLPNFYLYVDEFQSFANESFADILSEARKYHLSLTVAHQYIEQMSDEVRAAVFGNVGTMISFRVGSYDAEVLEKEFAPAFVSQDIVNLGFSQIYLKLMIDGVGSAPFSATTLPPLAPPPTAYVPEIISASRRQFARPREAVEEEIKKWYEPIPPPPRAPRPDGVVFESGDRKTTLAPSQIPMKPGFTPRPAPIGSGGPPNYSRTNQDTSRPTRDYANSSREGSSPVRREGGAPPERIRESDRLPREEFRGRPRENGVIEQQRAPRATTEVPRSQFPPAPHRPFAEGLVRAQEKGDVPPSLPGKESQQVPLTPEATQARTEYEERKSARLREEKERGGYREGDRREQDRRTDERRDTPRRDFISQPHPPRPESAPLSSLKFDAKRDKGPSSAHLADLRSTLASLTDRPSVPQPPKIPEIPHRGVQDNNVGQPRERVPEPVSPPSTPVSPQISHREQMLPHSLRKSPTEERSSPASFPGGPPEIPEDVLRDILRIE